MVLGYIIGVAAMTTIVAIASYSDEWRQMRRTTDGRAMWAAVWTMILLWPITLLVAVVMVALRR